MAEVRFIPQNIWLLCKTNVNPPFECRINALDRHKKPPCCPAYLAMMTIDNACDDPTSRINLNPL